MKYVCCLIILFASVCYADELDVRKLAASCAVGDNKGTDCEIVKVLTRCDVDKQALRNKIALLERKVKQLEAMQQPTELHQYTDHFITTKVIEEKEVIKHNILGLYMARDYFKTESNNSGGTTLETAYLPGIKYQYQFGFGLVPEIGINTKAHVLFGLGWEF